MPLPPGAPVSLTIDPRLRQRRVEVKRRQGRRRLHVLLAILGMLALSGGAWVASRSPLLDVDTIQVEGSAHTPAQTIALRSGIRRGEAMVDVDGQAAAHRLAAVPWVAAAHVARRLPGTVVITVTERTATAVSSTNGDRWAVLDKQGRVLEVDPVRPAGLPQVEGVDLSAEPGSTIAAASGPLAVLEALPPELESRTAAVAAVGGGQVELKLNPRGTVRIGPPVEVAAKVRAVETILSSVDVRDLAVLDVRFPASPVLTRG